MALVALAASLALASVARAQRDDATDRARAFPEVHQTYRIEARLDAERHVVAGVARIAWTNTSAVPATELYAHLYMNAFESDRTVFMRESRGELRGVRFGVPGSIRLERFELAGRDLLPDADDELVAGDRTQLRVPLPAPVPPGGTIELVIPFETTLPTAFARAGFVGAFHMVGQWFPKLARLEPDGTWRSFPYHGLGEFYADFARYEVTLDLPADHVVGATGVEVESTTRGDRTVRRFVAEPVHDFAFASDARLRATSDACHGVDVKVLALPGFERVAARALRVTCAGLAYFGRSYGPYPYPALTVVFPPRGGGGAAGMEYPMLFTTDGDPFALDSVHFGGVDDTTAHELAHQWFQGLVATDEVRHPMLDEGLTTWAGYDLAGELFGRGRSFSEVPPLDYFDVLRPLTMVRGDPPAIRDVTAFSARSYGRVIYGRVPMLFETLARTYGRHRVHQALGDYARRHRFAHPSPDDLLAALERAFGPRVVRDLVRPVLERGADAAARVARDGDGVVAIRDGDAAVPLRVVVRCGGATATRQRFAADARRMPVAIPPECGDAEVRLDPARANLLDPWKSDDRLSIGAAPRWAAQVLAWIVAAVTGVLT